LNEKLLPVKNKNKNKNKNVRGGSAGGDVPDLDGLVGRGGEDRVAVGRPRDGENRAGVGCAALELGKLLTGGAVEEEDLRVRGDGHVVVAVGAETDAVDEALVVLVRLLVLEWGTLEKVDTA